MREKQHKKIVGSATDVGDCLLYPTVLRYIRIRICLLDKKRSIYENTVCSSFTRGRRHRIIFKWMRMFHASPEG